MSPDARGARRRPEMYRRADMYRLADKIPTLLAFDHDPITHDSVPDLAEDVHPRETWEHDPS